MRAARQAERPHLLAVAAACALVFAILAMPARPQDAVMAGMARFPVELALIAGLLAALPRNSSVMPALRVIFTGLLGIAILVKCADLGLYASLNRPFNFAYDLPLLHAGWMLASGTSGTFAAVLYLLGGTLALAAFTRLGGLQILEGDTKCLHLGQNILDRGIIFLGTDFAGLLLQFFNLALNIQQIAH